MYIVRGFLIGVSLLLFGMLLVTAATEPQLKRMDACLAVGGHYVDPGPFEHDQCWTQDGRGRLFPEGF